MLLKPDGDETPVAPSKAGFWRLEAQKRWNSTSSDGREVCEGSGRVEACENLVMIALLKFASVHSSKPRPWR